MSIVPKDDSIPPGWSWAKVDDLADFINGLAFKPSDWEQSGRPIIRIQNLTGANEKFNRTTKNYPAEYLVQPGDILVSWSATLDTFVWKGPESVLNQHIFKVVPRKSSPDKRFIYWVLKKALAEMWKGESTHGTTMRHINRGPFLAHGIPLPPPQEQSLIVSAIEDYFSRLDEAVMLLKRVQRNLKRYRASVLKAAVEGRLVPTEAELARAGGRSYEPASVLLERILEERRRRWKASGAKGPYKEPAAPDTTNLPPLPEGWCWATVDQLASDVTYGTSAKTSENSENGTPVVRMGNIVDGEFDFTNFKYLPTDHLEFPNLLLRQGDLLFNRTNSAELVGKCAVFQRFPAPVSFASYLIRVRFVEGVLSEYVSAFINSVSGREWVASVAIQQVGQANVNGSKLKSCCIPLPPFHEQQRIRSKLENILSVQKRMERELATDLSLCHGLRQSILKWAFEGRLAGQHSTYDQSTVLNE